MDDLVENVVTRYEGEARIQRLRWIAAKATAEMPSTASLRAAAAQALATACQQDGNLPRYREIFEGNIIKTHEISTLPEGLAKMDVNWVQETDAAQRQDRTVLRHRLQSVQSHLHKEAIRAAYLALAEHDCRVGDVVEAFHSVLRAKDYCTTRQQTTAVCLSIVNLSFLLGNQASAKEYLLRLDHTIGNDTPPQIRQQIQTASGMERLLAGDYAKAAQLWAEVCKQGLEPSSSATTATATSTAGGESPASIALATSPRNGASPSAAGGPPVPAATVVAPEDVSLYAAFLAMGCAKGPDMITLAEHPEALELVPRLKDALVLFGRRCDYRAAWAVLEESLFPVLKYDLFLAPHLNALQTMIREKAVASYWKAYERVELAVMAEELGSGIVPSVQALQALLVKLIQRGCLPDSRIDLSTQTIHRDAPLPRQLVVQAKLDAMTRTTLDDTYSTLTRLACLEYDLVVSDGGGAGSPRGRRGGRGRGGSGPSAIMEDAMMDERDEGGMDVGDDINPEDLY